MPVSFSEHMHKLLCRKAGSQINTKMVEVKKYLWQQVK